MTVNDSDYVMQNLLQSHKLYDKQCRIDQKMKYYIFSSFISRHSLDDNVRLSLYQACDDWMKALGKRKYLGGDEPCIADLVSPSYLHV